jgi:predicted RNA-binding Zn-ribbon protein involved in translation (DUF1610 family)
MQKPPFEIAGVLREHLPEFRRLHGLSLQQHKAAHAIMQCRTAVLGGHVDACSSCGHWLISYNSCNNRHCPKCQWAAQQRWISKRMEELLPTHYFHLVFTLPDLLNPVVMCNEAKIYDLLLRTAWETLDQLTRQPQWLGAQTGMITVLHTWGQNLSLHPHAHCIVPGGGLNDEGRWISARPKILLPVRVLSRLFRGKFLHQLRSMYQAGKLHFYGQYQALEVEKTFLQLLGSLYRTEWVVYAKRPFGGPAQVINYLGRYTHRVAISNSRITAIENGNVSFTYKDYRQNGIQKVMTLQAVEFIRRFLQHCLPPGFQKIRYYGILATKNRKTKLLLLQQLMKSDKPDTYEEHLPVTTAKKTTCPVCGRQAWQHLGVIPAQVFRSGQTMPDLVQKCPRAPPNKPSNNL